jgi:aldehyde dehydrogenase (NAD+)
MTDEFKNFIDGKWVASASGSTFPSINPANKSEVLGAFPRSDHRDVDRAAESARGHCDAWRVIPAPRRAEVFHRAAESLRAHADDLATLITREMGKILPEARDEVRETIALLAFIAGEGRRLFGTTLPSGLPDQFALCIRVPLGVVAAITPWSAPLAVAAADLAFALVAGNTVVFKPAEDTPLLATRLVEFLLEAGLPPGAVNLVHGMGEEAGAPLVRHPEVRLVTFAGSGAVGREVAIACAAEHKRLALGVGGKNVLVVMDDADLDLALEAAVRGAFATAGQRPTSVGRLILHRAIAREFTERLVARAGALRLGDGLLPTTDMGPLVNEVRLKRAHAYARHGVKEGARLLCGGEAFREGDCKRGFFYLPTVLGEVRPAMRIAQEEVLGPAVCLLTVRDLQGAVGAVHGMRPTCSVSLFSRDVQRALLAVRDLQAGHIALNALAAEVHGAAGALGSAGGGGWGGGAPRMDRFTEWKTISLGIGWTGPGHPGD